VAFRYRRRGAPALAGLVKGGLALVDRHSGRVWTVLAGLVSILIGGLIWAAWPESSHYAIGVLIGIDLLATGVAWIGRALWWRTPTMAERGTA
jgi:uncharacterized membrane protein HdeD (DUF308 family)